MSPDTIVRLAFIAAVGVIVAIPFDTARRAVLVGCVVSGAWYMLRAAEAERATGREDDTREVARAAASTPPPTAADAEGGVLLGGASYQVRRMAVGTQAISLHSDVEAAIADLARMRNAWSPGALRNAVTAVETFLHRYHGTLMCVSDSFTARQDVPILLDARREALNALHFLEFGVSHARVAPVRRAVEVVRASCARCMRVIRNKHPVALQGVVMRAPYPGVDSMLSRHLVE